MNTRNRITLLLSVVMVLALLVVGMAITASAADGDVETEYGTVPAANANDCFAIFHKAEGAKEYTFLKSVADAFKDSVWEDYQSHTGHFAVVALNDSTITASSSKYFTNFVSMKADITFDLNGKTVNTNFTTSGTKNSGLFWIRPVVVTEDTERNILIENGTITISADNIVLVASDNTLSGEKLVVNMTFRNVTFDQVDGKNTDQPIVQPSKNAIDMITNILFDECTFDARGRKTDAGYYLHAGYRGSGYSPLTYTVKGGAIYVDDATNFILTLGTVNFEDGKDGPTKLITPASLDISAIKLNQNTLTFGYFKEKSDESFNYYRLPSLNTEYGAISTTYANIDRFPFIIFTKAEGATAWTLHTTQADTTATKSGSTELEPKLNTPWGDSIYTSYRTIDGEVAILMRRDVDYFNNTAGFSNGFRMVPTVTVDLNGYTFTSSNKVEAYFNFATKALEGYDDGEPREYIFANGTIVTKDKPFMLFKASAEITNNPVINVTFNDVTFKRAEGATKEQPFIEVGFVPEGYEYNANVVYNDCTFDVRGAFGSSGLYLFSISSAHKTLTYKSLLHLTQKVNGGKILADTTEKFKMVLNSRDNGSTIKFDKGSNGKDLQVILPNGVENKLTPNTSNLVYDAQTGVALAFQRVSADAGYTTYQLSPYWLTQYVPKTSITLSTDLIYNIYLPTSRYVSATVNGTNISELGAEKVTLDDGIEYFHVAISSGLLNAGDEILLVTTINGGSNIPVSATRRLNAVKYAKNLLASNPTEVEEKLVKDMLAYVKAACVYANDKAETVAAIEAVIGADYTVTPDTSLEAKQTTAGLSSAALLLGDKPAFVFYPELDEAGNAKYDLSAYKFAIGNTTVNTETAIVGGKAAILVYTYAYAMTETVTYTIEGTEISGEYNLAAYLANAMTLENSDSLVSLVKALWQYAESAKAYKTEQAA